jgi:hypothetical protein
LLGDLTVRKLLERWRLVLPISLACAVLVVLGVRGQPLAEGGGTTSDRELEITISGHLYSVPKSYIAYYDGHREGEREGVLLRVALPAFTPWVSLNAAKRKSTPWASILIEEGPIEGYTERVLNVYGRNPKYAKPRPYNPKELPDQSMSYDLYTLNIGDRGGYSIVCRRRICVLHYINSDAIVRISFPVAYFVDLLDLAQKANRFIASLQH